MIISITFPSAAIFWLKYNPATDLEQYTPDKRILSDLPDNFELPSDIREAAELLSQFKDLFPVTVIGPSEKRKYMDNKILKTKRAPEHLPPLAFVKISPRIYVASPEYCFLKAASVLNLEQLIMFGNELCGKYIHDDNSEFYQISRTPATCVESIKRFLRNSQGCYGYAKALKAAAYIMDNSNSFMESMLAAFIRLPICLGGYALKKPELNKMANLSEEGKAFMNGKPIYSDIVWEPEKVIVEYDSDISHLSSAQHSKDKQRASALAVSGYKVISITRNNVRNLTELDKTFRMLRKVLGMQGVKSRLDKYRNKRKTVLYSFQTFRSYDISSYKKHRPKNDRRTDSTEGINVSTKPNDQIIEENCRLPEAEN